MAINTLDPKNVTKIDLSKEDFKITGLYLSEVNLFDRSKDNKSNLIFVKFVGTKKLGVSPSMLYFGDLEYKDLEDLRGSKVDILLGASDKGFNVQVIQLSSN